MGFCTYKTDSVAITCYNAPTIRIGVAPLTFRFHVSHNLFYFLFFLLNQHQGKNKGVSSWILHLPDGQWCYNATHCVNRSRTHLGSSSDLPSSIPLSDGIFSNDPEVNPDFSDWNVVQLHYCDGASFSSRLKGDPVQV